MSIDSWRAMAHTDANDLIYYFDASRNYDPSPHLDQIKAPVMWINSADDYINPPELGIAGKNGEADAECAICDDSDLRRNTRTRHAYGGGDLGEVPG